MAGVDLDVAEQEPDGSWTLHATTAPGRGARCPGCAQEAGRVKEPAGHTVRHLVVAPVRVVWHKNRYFCDNEACGQATFCEGGPLVGRGGTVSEPGKDTMGHLVGDWLVPVGRVAGAAGVSWHTAHRGFAGVAAEAGVVVTETTPDAETAVGTGTDTETTGPGAEAGVDATMGTGTGTECGGEAGPGAGGEPVPAGAAAAAPARRRPGRLVSGPLPPVEVLGIDDHRRGKPLYHRDPDTGKWVEDADRWQCVFVDTTGGHGLLGQAEGRAAADAVAWLAAQDKTWRDGVKHVTIDMSTVFKAAVRQALPNAALAVDPFHVAQLANKAVGDVRRRVTYERHRRRGRATDPEYKIKNLLVRGREKLSAKARGKLLCTLSELGDAGRQLTAVWNAKEKLRGVLALSPTRTGRATCRSQVSAALEAFFDYCATVGATVPEVVALAETVSVWREEIATAVLTGYSNAAAEGVNRLIKLVYRAAFGFTNVTNQQRRSRYAASRSTRPQWLQPVIPNPLQLVVT